MERSEITLPHWFKNCDLCPLVTESREWADEIIAANNSGYTLDLNCIPKMSSSEVRVETEIDFFSGGPTDEQKKVIHSTCPNVRPGNSFISQLNSR